MSTDPFAVLRRPSSPAAPDPAFAATLRRRIERMTLVNTANLNVIHIRVRNADRAYAFFHELLGWESDPFTSDGKTTHYIFNTPVLLTLGEGAPDVRLSFSVPDVRTTAQRLVDLGGRLETEITDEYVAAAEDDQGLPIALWSAVGPQRGPRQAAPALGSVGHVGIVVPDKERALAFYGSLFGWRFDEPFPDYPHVAGAEIPIGFEGGAAEPRIGLALRVDDIEPLVEKVRELGGTAGEITHAASGATARCVDADGNEFALWEPASGYR